MANTTCRRCSRSAAETATPLFAGAVAFTCSSCLMTGANSRPICRRCLGAHWDAECEYNVAEAKAAFSARLRPRVDPTSKRTRAAVWHRA